MRYAQRWPRSLSCKMICNTNFTPADAQRIQDESRAADGLCMWFVADHGDRVVAWAVIADPHGGAWRGELVGNGIDEVRAMLPRGLKRGERTSVMPPEVVAVWD